MQFLKWREALQYLKGFRQESQMLRYSFVKIGHKFSPNCFKFEVI
jgi:hypothetical protein